MSANDPEIFALIKKCITEVLGVADEAIVPASKFGDDIDADSLDKVEVMMSLEGAFGLFFPEEELEDIDTVQDVYDLIVGKMGPKSKN